jgi:hypothetical protein
MNPYILVTIIFTVILGAVYLLVSMPRTVYMPIDEGAQEDVEARKKRAQQMRSRTFIYSIGGVIGACLLTMLCIALTGPAKTVYGAFNPTVTPTVTRTPTITPTRTEMPTRTPSPTKTISAADLGATVGAGTVTATLKPNFLTPSGGGTVTGGGSKTITIIQTKLVQVPVTVVSYQTRVVTVVVPATSANGTPFATYTPYPTYTVMPTHTPPYYTPTMMPIFSLTPTPMSTQTPYIITVVVSLTPTVPTQTPYYIVVTATPSPTPYFSPTPVPVTDTPIPVTDTPIPTETPIP